MPAILNYAVARTVWSEAGFWCYLRSKTRFLSKPEDKAERLSSLPKIYAN